MIAARRVTYERVTFTDLRSDSFREVVGMVRHTDAPSRRVAVGTFVQRCLSQPVRNSAPFEIAWGNSGSAPAQVLLGGICAGDLEFAPASFDQAHAAADHDAGQSLAVGHARGDQ